MKIHITAHKYPQNPVLTPEENIQAFDKACVYNPAAIVKENKVFLIYRGEEDYYKRYISRLGLAISEDGFHFKRYDDNPVMKEDLDDPTETNGCEDPRLIKVNNRYFLTYVAYGGNKNITLRGAFSDDLIHWTKTKPLVQGREKSGAIVQAYKYNSQYVMYFGDSELKFAFSKDLQNWKANNVPVLSPRTDSFDNFLIEGGPPPILTDQGILVIYNSASGNTSFDGTRKFLSYAPGFAVFDKNDPAKLLYRSDKPIIQATEYWEKYGKINYVIFATALVYFNNKWLLYYGGADKSIGVAELKFEGIQPLAS